MRNAPMLDCRALFGSAVLWTLAACGGAAPEPGPESQATNPAASAGMPDAETADDSRPLGLPEAAVLLRDEPGRRLWGERRADGRVGLIEELPGGQMSGTAGPLDKLAEFYPDVDFSPLGPDGTDGDAATGDDGDASLDAVRANRDRLVEVTPGAREVLARARRGNVIELTADSLTHMVEGMGGSLAMPREDLERLLASNNNRIGLSSSDMKQLMKEAGPQGISLAQIEALLPPPAERQAAADAPAGRTDADCPGLVYGAGKREICLPLGARSFADTAVAFRPGDKPSRTPFDFPGSALGEPNYRSTSSADFISLGCDGELLLQFTDNVLVDVEGVDLYVFEIGPIVERTELAISIDGREWIEVGVIEGARSDVDIRPFAKKGEKYGFVRLRNAGKACGGQHAGADIDAVAAVGAEIRLSLDSALLFDVGKSELKPEALAALDDIARQVSEFGRDIRVTVEGHTDSTGSDDANRRLSEARARSVWAYLATRIDIANNRVSIQGYGETRPVADNATDEGRAKNRRVDLLIAPQSRIR